MPQGVNHMSCQLLPFCLLQPRLPPNHHRNEHHDQDAPRLCKLVFAGVATGSYCRLSFLNMPDCSFARRPGLPAQHSTGCKSLALKLREFKGGASDPCRQEQPPVPNVSAGRSPNTYSFRQSGSLQAFAAATPKLAAACVFQSSGQNAYGSSGYASS